MEGLARDTPCSFSLYWEIISCVFFSFLFAFFFSLFNLLLLIWLNTLWHCLAWNFNILCSCCLGENILIRIFRLDLLNSGSQIKFLLLKFFKFLLSFLELRNNGLTLLGRLDFVYFDLLLKSIHDFLTNQINLNASLLGSYSIFLRLYQLVNYDSPICLILLVDFRDLSLSCFIN